MFAEETIRRSQGPRGRTADRRVTALHNPLSVSRSSRTQAAGRDVANGSPVVRLFRIAGKRHAGQLESGKVPGLTKE